MRARSTGASSGTELQAFVKDYTFFLNLKRDTLQISKVNVPMGASQSLSSPDPRNYCECHKVNWLKILDGGNYEMVDGSPFQTGVSCEDKVEDNHMSEEDYETICKYVPGGKGSRFPEEVIKYLLNTINSSLFKASVLFLDSIPNLTPK